MTHWKETIIGNGNNITNKQNEKKQQFIGQLLFSWNVVVVHIPDWNK